MAALAEAITPWFRAAVLLAACCGLRRVEVAALRREDIDLDAGTVTVRHARVELLESPGAAFDADPKADAGKRTVAVPAHVLPFLRAHMSAWAGPDRVFVGRDGQPARGDAIRHAFTRGGNTAFWHNSVDSALTQRSRSTKHQGLSYEHTDRSH